MNQYSRYGKNQNGFAMVLSLFILAILSMVGLLAAKSTTTEVHMATNEMHHKLAFYSAEGVTELVSEILEQNIACPNGFTENLQRGGLVQVATADFWKNEYQPGRLPADNQGNTPPVRDMRIPVGTPDSEPHTNVLIHGAPSFSSGNSLQAAAGYLGIGRSLGNCGAHLIYDQIIQHKGRFNSEALVKIQWRHVIGSEGICYP